MIDKNREIQREELKDIDRETQRESAFRNNERESNRGGKREIVNPRERATARANESWESLRE